jgi:AcrR family transcriptional regulator
VSLGRACGDGGPPLRAEAIASAERLFLQYGYSGTSISMIAEALGVTKAALYYHFPDKEALFLAVFDEYLRCVSADLASIAPLFAPAGPAPAGGRGRPAANRAREAFRALADVFLSRGQASVSMQRLCFQESPRLGEAGRLALGEKYHRDLVRPVEAFFRLASESGWLRDRGPGEPSRVWLFMGILSAFFAPGRSATGEAVPDAETAASAFAEALLAGIGAGKPGP